MLLGGNPFQLKELCVELDLINALQDYNGLMVGLSAGAMFMSKYIIITPCSEEYPDFQVEEGLNLDGISIYPHNNTEEEEYPQRLVAGDETYVRNDLLKVAAEYGEFYLIQDHLRESGATDVSLIKVSDGRVEYYTENQGKIWKVMDGKVTKLV
ncbi:MAG: Type 1 glutamine amidotransferase-like domain-containing protein [Lachnospiraceae bacterium]|nr:Type 1 glutamine amidotransferase-like domain-containing protein [Lachnospiraceae bacterium]